MKKKKKSIGENFKETGRSRYIYENELDKDYFIQFKMKQPVEERRRASDTVSRRVSRIKHVILL